MSDSYLLDDREAKARFEAPPASDVAVISLLRSLPPLTMPADLVAALEGRLPAHTALIEVPPAEVVDISTRRRPRWTAPLAVAASVALLLTLGAVVFRSTDATIVNANGPILASGTEYTAANLATAVPELLNAAGLSATNTVSEARIAPADPATIAATFAASPDSLGACIDAITDAPTAQLVTVDMATFRGIQVGVITTRVSGARGLTVSVVPTDCGANNASILDQIVIADL